jgi:hypothetical protein
VWRVVASLFGATLALVTRTALATPPPVHLDVEACDSLDAVSIRRIFAADLGTPLTPELGPDVTQVDIGCEGDHVVVLVKDPLSRKTVRRSFDPKSFGNQGQSRLIAIAASELVLASWAELAANPTPKVLGEGEPVKPETVQTARGVVESRSPKTQPTPTPPGENPFAGESLDGESSKAASKEAAGSADSARPDANAPAVVHRVTAVISLRSFVRGDGTLYGGGARYGQDRYGVISWAADALVEGGNLSGHEVTSTTLGGWVAFYLHQGPATFRIGGGLRAGVLSFADGSSLAAWGWPMLVTSLSLRSGPLILDIGGESGLVNLLLHQSQQLRGVWVSGQAGLGLVL